MDSIFGKSVKKNVSKALQSEGASLNELRIPLESILSLLII